MTVSNLALDWLQAHLASQKLCGGLPNLGVILDRSPKCGLQPQLCSRKHKLQSLKGAAKLLQESVGDSSTPWPKVLNQNPSKPVSLSPTPRKSKLPGPRTSKHSDTRHLESTGVCTRDGAEGIEEAAKVGASFSSGNSRWRDPGTPQCGIVGL